MLSFMKYLVVLLLFLSSTQIQFVSARRSRSRSTSASTTVSTLLSSMHSTTRPSSSTSISQSNTKTQSSSSSSITLSNKTQKPSTSSSSNSLLRTSKSSSISSLTSSSSKFSHSSSTTKIVILSSSATSLAKSSTTGSSASPTTKSSLTATVSHSTIATSKTTSGATSLSRSTSANSAVPTSSVTRTISSTTRTSTSVSIQIGTPTGCPFLTLGNLIWQNATSETSGFGLYGTTDINGLPATARQLGIWSASDLSSWPDLLIDISNPAIMQAVFTQNRSNVVIDTVNKLLNVNNCSTEAILPLGSISKRDMTRLLSPQKNERRQSFNSRTFAVSLTYTTQCGEPDQWQEPHVYCIDETPSLQFHPYPSPAHVVQTSPGVYTTSCTFVEPDSLWATSPECTTLYPLLKQVCAVSDMISAPCAIAGTICFPLSVRPESVELYLPCVEVVSKLADFCGVLDAINGGGEGSGLKAVMCGPIPSVTRMRVAVGGKSWFSPLYDLGVQNSNAPHDLAFTISNPAPLGAKCSACSSSGSQTLYTPWEEVYSGPLFVGIDWSCDLDYYGNIPGVSDFGSAQSFCQAFAEERNDAIWIANLETVVDGTGTPVDTPSGGCWAGSCPLSNSDFTLDFQSLNLNPDVIVVDEVIAYTRTVTYIPCAT